MKSVWYETLVFGSIHAIREGVRVVAKQGSWKLILVSIWMIAALSGCGGGSGGVPALMPLAVNPSSVTLDTNTSFTFQVSGGKPPYTFAVSSGSGTISSSSGIYLAPSAAGTAVVAVTDSLGAVARGTVAINPPVAIAPTASAVAINTSQQFTASGSKPPYSYSIGSGLGAIDSSTGVLQAPNSKGTVSVTVTDSLGGTASTTLTVNGVLKISPSSISMTSSSGQSYSFAGQDGALDYQYAILSGSGSIDAHGLYTAGDQSGAVALKVTDRQGASATATVQLTHLRTNGPVYAAATDGANWFLGGRFTAVNPYQASRMAVIDPDSGAPRLACDLAAGFDGEVLSLAYSGSTLLVGGFFSHYRGQATPGGLAQLDPVTCALTATFFKPGDGANSVSALVVNGSSLYIAGNFATYQGQLLSPYQYGLVKVDVTTGKLDGKFSQTTTFNGFPRRMLATPTTLYVAGDFSGPNNSSAVGVTKIDAMTGAISLSFNAMQEVAGPVYALQLRGGSLYVGGWFSNVHGNLIKVDADTGTRDPTFNSNSGFNLTVRDMELSGTALVVVGDFSSYGTQSAQSVAKIDAANGALDTAFASTGGFNGRANALTVIGNSLYVAGAFTKYQGQPAVALAKVDASSGALDSTFSQVTGLDNTVNALAASSTSLYAGGVFRTYRGFPVSNIAKLNSVGALDTKFTSPVGFNDKVASLALVGSSLYAGGSFSTFAGAPANYVAKIDATSGALDSQFTQTTGFDRRVFTMTINGSSLYVGGDFSSYRGIVSNGLAKMDLNTGDLDNAFVVAAALPANTIVSTLASNGSFIYLGENASTYGGVTTGAGRINAVTGANDLAFANISLGSYTNAFAFSPTAVYVAGNYGVTPISKYDINTATADSAFITTIGTEAQPIHALTVVNASLYVGGQYPSGGVSAFDMTPAKLDLTTGAPDPTFSQVTAVDGDVFVITSTGSALYLGGEFTEYRGHPAYFFIPVDPISGAVLDQ